MEKQRIVVHILNPEDRAIALEILQDPIETAAFVTGYAADEVLKTLEGRGLMIELVGDSRRLPQTKGLAADAHSRIFTNPPKLGDERADGRRISSLAIESMLQANDDKFLTDELAAAYELRIPGPMLPPYTAALRKLGVEIEQAIRREVYVVKLTASQLVGVRDLPFVEETRFRSGTVDDLPEGSLSAEATRRPDEEDRLMLDVRRNLIFEDPTPIHQAVREIGGKVEAASRRKLRISFPAGSPLGVISDTLSLLPEVELVEPYTPPELHQDHARQLVGLSPGAPGLGDALAHFMLDGAGEIIAVADTGIDEAHPDFSGRLKAAVALGRVGNVSDPVGHGTHVAGSALGGGTASGGLVCGIAPKAELYFQSLYSRTVAGRDYLEGLPLDLEDLFRPAFQAGARIHNNSWGSPQFLARYSISANEVDAFMHENPEMLIVFSAGNEGTAQDPLYAKKGFVDLLSVTSPSTAKNALSVGAQRSDRKVKGLAEMTFGEFGQVDYPDAPISRETLGGDSEALAAFSSRGPTGDERIKPDLVAPGTSILSARSKDAEDWRFWGSEADHDGKYGYMGGTSMAAPIVAGAAALVRQHYRQNGVPRPSAALIKATLINGARFLTAADAVASNAGAPNYDQGFGALDLRQTLPNPNAPDLKLLSLDASDRGSGALSQTGDLRRYRIRVRAETPLRVCLAWTDPPGHGIQNDLDLWVRRVDPSARWRLGNEDRRKLREGSDHDNNVEIVRILAPEAGFYEIRIVAWTIIRPPQSFALVVTGAVDGQIDAIA